MIPNDNRTPIRRFEDEVVALIDGADSELTIAEMLGVLELQAHILKMRFYPGVKKMEEP